MVDDRLVVVHAGASRNAHSVNGANQAIWALARAQADRGLKVLLISGGRVVEVCPSATTPSSVRPSAFSAFGLRRLREEYGPFVLHLHSVYLPFHAVLAACALGLRIPYVITPHGGYMPQILRRHGMLKRLYRWTIERMKVARASAVIAVAPSEVSDVERFLGREIACAAVVPNIVNTSAFLDKPGEYRLPRFEADVVYLGRLETQWKGIDRVAALAAALPHLRFVLFGSEHPSFDASSLPANARMMPPVFDAEKLSVLREAKVLVQLSRWEVFGMSVLEAMLAGTQVMVSREMYISKWAESHGALVFDEDFFDDSVAGLAAFCASPSPAQEVEARKAAAEGLISADRNVESLSKIYRDVLAKGPN